MKRDEGVSLSVFSTQTSGVIGNSIKIGKLEIAEFDFPAKLNWSDSKIACSKLGAGWRLPTMDELGLLHSNKDKLNNFSTDGLGYYWSSETSGIKSNARIRSIDAIFTLFDYKTSKNFVRAVKSINN